MLADPLPSGNLNLDISELGVNDCSRMFSYFNSSQVIGSSGVEIDIFDVNVDTDSVINDLSFLTSYPLTAAKTARYGNNGLKAFINTGSAIQEYNLSIAYDISSASYVNQLSTTGLTGTIKDFDISNDGTKLIILGTNSNALYEYSLSGAWTISSGTYQARSFSLTTQDSDMRSVHLSADGLRVICLGYNNDSFYQYTLGSSFNLTSVTYNTSLGLSSYIVNPASDGLYQYPIAVSADGLRVIVPYITGSGATLGMWYKEIKLLADCQLSGAVTGIRVRGFRDSPNAINPAIFDISPNVGLLNYCLSGSATGTYNIRTLRNKRNSKLFLKGFGFSNIDMVRIWLSSLKTFLNGSQIGGLENDLLSVFGFSDKFSIYDTAVTSGGRVAFFVPYRALVDKSIVVKATVGASSNTTNLTVIGFYDRV